MVIPPFGLLFLSIIQDSKPSPGKQKGYSRIRIDTSAGRTWITTHRALAPD